MSLESFQQAFAELAASPALCRLAIRDPARAFQGYSLTRRELNRLAELVRQPGMETNCRLYRANRTTPVCVFLPLTSTLLGPRLVDEMEAFWVLHPDAQLQFELELRRFACFLKNRIRDGAIGEACLEEVLEFEMAVNELQFEEQRDGGLTTPVMSVSDRHDLRFRLALAFTGRTIKFRHDHRSLLKPLSEGMQVAADLREVEQWVLIFNSEGQLMIRELDPLLGEILHRMEADEVSQLSYQEASRLVEAELATWVA